MEQRTYWPFSVRNFPQELNIPAEKLEVDPSVIKMIYESRFYGKPQAQPSVGMNAITIAAPIIENIDQIGRASCRERVCLYV